MDLKNFRAHLLQLSLPLEIRTTMATLFVILWFFNAVVGYKPVEAESDISVSILKKKENHIIPKRCLIDSTGRVARSMIDCAAACIQTGICHFIVNGGDGCKLGSCSEAGSGRVYTIFRDCHPGVQIGSKCYFYNETRVHWRRDAENSCLSNGWKLAEPMTRDIALKLNEFAPGPQCSGGHYFALRNPKTGVDTYKGVTTWNGDVVPYNTDGLWKSGQPNSDGQEAMVLHKDGWSDRKMSIKKSYKGVCAVCEW